MKNLCKHFSGGGNFKHPVTSCAKGTILSLLLAACTTAFTACNNEEALPDTGNQLKLSFGINAPQSRAIFTDTKLPDSSPVGVTLDGYADYANLVYTGTTTSGKQTWTPDKQVRLSDTQGTLYAYYPYSSTTSINAIDIDMTAADQTDWLYATPVTGICEDKAEAAVTMNHALANINVTVNKGSYLGEGAISNITLQSDGIALGGTFNAAQATPGYTAFENEGEPLSRNVTTTAGAATDIMVVPTGTSAAVNFLLTIDGIQFTAKSEDVTLEMGNSYLYTLNLSDISTYMTIGSFGVTPWGTKTGGTLELEEYVDKTIKVYAVSATGELIDYKTADATATGVALVAGKHKFMIAKNIATDGTNYTLYWGQNLYEKDVAGVGNNSRVNGTNYWCYLPKSDGTYQSTPNMSGDFTTWKAGALAEFNGKANTAAIIEAYTELGVEMNTRDMCKVVQDFNAGINSKSNEGFNDWYVPACGQLALMFLAKADINSALAIIGGTTLTHENYWSSSEKSASCAWYVNFLDGEVTGDDLKYKYYRVRFVRDLQ